MTGDVKAVAARFGLAVQPMVHVKNLRESLAFYEALGGALVFGSRDGDWALVRFGGTAMSVLAHAPNAGAETVELHFTASSPLETIEREMRAIDPGWIAQGCADEAFGRMLKLRSPEGLVVKILELERDLIT